MKYQKLNSKNLPPYIHGIMGICNLFNCSATTAWRYKNTWLAPAVRKVGKKISIETELALKLYAEECLKKI